MHLTFEEWMIKVNTHLNKLCGMGANDLPDYCYRDSYNDGVPSWECAKDALSAAKENY